MTGNYWPRHMVAGLACFALTIAFWLAGCQKSPLNRAAVFGWRASLDTDLKFDEFLEGDHTVMARFMPQYPRAYAGPLLAEERKETSVAVRRTAPPPIAYFIGLGDMVSGTKGSKILVNIGGNTATYTLSEFLAAETWYHLALIAKQAWVPSSDLASVNAVKVYKLYVNGEHIERDGMTGVISNGDLVVPVGTGQMPVGNSVLRMGGSMSGQRVANVQPQFYGFIDDVAVFNRALTEQEIKNIANHPDKRLHGDEPHLLAGWTFDETAPGGGALPDRLARPATLNGPASIQVVSMLRNDSTDATLLPLPFQKTELTLPFKAGQAWRVIQGFASDGSHSGPSAFSLDLVLEGAESPGKATNPHDASASCGEPVYSVAAGQMTHWSDAGGSAEDAEDPQNDEINDDFDGANYIVVEHPSKEIMGYMHFFTGSVTQPGGTFPGQLFGPVNVAAGQQIATVGTRNGCHLHLGMHDNVTLFPWAFSNYEISNNSGADWFAVKRGVPKLNQLVRRP